MNAVHKPQSLEEVKELSLALDDYIKGIEACAQELTYIDRIKEVASTTPGDLPYTQFAITQKFVDGVHGRLGVPEGLKTSLEYFNNRPLKELVLENLDQLKGSVSSIANNTVKYVAGYLENIGQDAEVKTMVEKLRSVESLTSDNLVLELNSCVSALRTLLG